MSSASLPVVEALLHEFYQPATPNARKREIETELIAFRTQPAAWQLSLGVVATTTSAVTQQASNQFLWFFCTATLEHNITRRWAQLSSGDRTLLRETLWHTYANLSASVPRRQRDTYAQLIALLGKHEFPDEHSSYMLHCIELLKSKFLLGITLLRTTSEEVMSNREDLTTDRKNYFHSCISMCIPDVMDLITKYLLITVCHINGKDIHSISSTIIDYSLATSLPNDNQLSFSTVELLSCIQHLVSWIRTDLISEYLLMSILDLSQWRTTYPDVSLGALSVLNELLYLQKALPYDTTLMTGVNGLLEQHNSIKQQSEIYVDKFRELLRLYSCKYWPKLMQENDLLERFLKSLFCCTIFKNGALDFTEKLEIWNPIIKGLTVNAKLNRYNDIIHQLVVEIMRRIQFEYNKTELEVLDNEIVEDNTQTEWQQFLTQCIECIALVAESRPNAVFAQVSSHWSRPHVYLMSIEHSIDSGSSTGKNCVELMRKLTTGQHFSEHLRDFSTVCQAVVRLAPLLDIASTDVRAEVNCQLQLLLDHLLTTLTFLSSGKLQRLEGDHSAFQTDLEYLHAQLLMAIRSILPMSAHVRTDDMLFRLFAALGSIFQASSIGVAPIVQMAASQLLLCIATVLRPKCLLEIPTVVSLMQAGPRLTHLPRPAVANIYISLISYFTLKWKNVADQHQELPRRSAMLREYIECLAQNFFELDMIADFAKVSTVTQGFLGTFSLVIEFFRDVSNTTKDILFNNFKPIIMKALFIYDIFGLRNTTLDLAIADFNLSVLRTLQSQVGTQFQCNMVTLFVSVSGREPLTASRLVVIERLLQMFQLIVQQPGNASLSQLPTILNFVIELILPMLQQNSKLTDCSDISNEVYTLFDSILTCKWQYFYKSHIQHNGSMLPSGSGAENQHPEQFLSILNAYGQILVSGNDPNVVRNVLTSMQNVNERWRLYQRPLFKDKLLASFQSALLNVLLCGDSGALHYDLLTNALFAMGQVNTLQLRESFAAVGFSINAKIINDICSATDIPTFSQKLSQLIQDAHCVHLTQT